MIAFTAKYSARETENEKPFEINQIQNALIRLLQLLTGRLCTADYQYAAMGLVLTAKSIARYDKITKDERFAEYYLLGTLLSTASVVLCKILILQN